MTISFIAVPQHRSLVSAVDFRLNCIYRAVATGTIERQWRTTADDMRVSEDLSWVAWAGRTAPFVRCVTEGIGNSAPVDQPDVFSGHLVRSVGKTSLAEMLSTHRQLEMLPGSLSGGNFHPLRDISLWCPGPDHLHLMISAPHRCASEYATSLLTPGLLSLALDTFDLYRHLTNSDEGEDE